MKLLKITRMIVALVLTLTIAMIVPLQTSAANGGKYVSEVYVAYGKDAEEAKKTLSDKGFTPVEGNLNDGGKTYAMMGYKTTDDIRDSITDLAVMNMHGDYSVEEYKKLLKGQKTEIAEFLSEFMAVIREYRANLKAGKTKATYVHDVLNNYTEDDTGMKMGDLLNSETLQDKVGIEESVEAANPENLPNLVTILMQGNAQVIKSMEILLSMATDTADNTWLDRFAETDYDALLDKVEEERPELNTENKRVQYLDNVYGDDAAALGMAVNDLRGKLTDYENSELHIDTVTEEDIKNTFGDIENDPTALVNYQEWLSIGTTYEGLKNYEGGNYAKGELLSFFLEQHEPEDIEIFIPMAASLSDGQRCGLPFISFEQLLQFAFTSEEHWQEYAEENASFFEGLEEVSVYQNIDRGLYKEDGSVALTGSAQRANNTAYGTTGDKESQMDTISKITAISWAATIGLGVVTAIATVTRVKMIYKFAWGKKTNQWIEHFWDVIFDDDTFNELVEDLGAKNSIVRVATKTRLAVKIAAVLQVITLAVAVFSAVMTIIDLCRDKSIEQLPIPNYLVDNSTDADGGSYSLNYKAVECNRMEYFGDGYTKQKGNCADLNADEGKQWLVLYASKNSKAGKPLTPDFVVQEKNTAPSGYEGFVHLIGEKGAVNVVSAAFKNYSTFSTVWQSVAGDYSMYIFSKLSNDIKTYDESAGNMTASALGDGMWAIFGFGGLVIGGALGAVIAVLVNKKKKKTEV